MPAEGRTLWRLLAAGIAAVAVLVSLWLFVLPIIVVVLSSFSQRWSGTILPASLTLRWFARLTESDWEAVATSLQVSLLVAVTGTVCGLWLALALEGRDRRGFGTIVDGLAMVPNAIPSVVLGLGVLIAYHTAPLDISGSPAIVVLVQLALVLPFCYRSAAAALRPELTVLREAAMSLGATPTRVMLRVVLPNMTAAIRSSLAIGLAVSLGELGATMTVYPPGFATAPIVILGQVERGYYLPASALAVTFLGCSLAVLLLLAVQRLPTGWFRPL